MAINTKLKRYIIRKYVMAKDVAHAIRKERTSSVDDVWVDEDWKSKNENFETIIKGLA